jgi:hypothetical protein
MKLAAVVGELVLLRTGQKLGQPLPLGFLQRKILSQHVERVD